jgi:hypothetical protein
VLFGKPSVIEDYREGATGYFVVYFYDDLAFGKFTYQDFDMIFFPIFIRHGVIGEDHGLFEFLIIPEVQV